MSLQVGSHRRQPPVFIREDPRKAARLIVGRIIQAVGGAAGMVITRAIVRDIYGPKGAARVLGTLIVATIGAPMLSIVLGGLITDLFGWRWIFGLSLVLGLIVAILAWATMRGGEKASGSVAGFAHMLQGYAVLGYRIQHQVAAALQRVRPVRREHVLNQGRLPPVNLLEGLEHEPNRRNVIYNSVLYNSVEFESKEKRGVSCLR